jgi:hypothetical protein
MKKPSRRKRTARVLARRDPLLDEVRRIRTEISEAYGHDLGKLCDHLREVQTNCGGNVVHKRSKRSPP